MVHKFWAFLGLMSLALGTSSTVAPSQPREPVHRSAWLPLGDGALSDAARSGHVFPCSRRFGGPGAHVRGPWIVGNLWDPTAKPHVAGEIFWPNARQSLMPRDQSLQISGNGLPVGQPTGQFPVARDDPAYAYDRNPNSIQAQRVAFAIPLRPQMAASPGCLPMGMVGVTVTGVALYNALDGQGRDAAAHEVQDRCNGHPQQRGEYHYHSASPCMPGAESNALIGWALDGHPIMGMRDAAGAELTNADLDGCHGRREELTIDGRRYGYAYRLTRAYPYTLGCFTGVVAEETLRATAVGPPPGGPPPPPRF